MANIELIPLVILGGIASFIDIKTLTVPNKIIKMMFLAWFGLMLFRIIMDISVAIPMVIDSVLGFVLGGGLFFLVYLGTKKQLGGGDIKFMAMVGLYLGMFGTIGVLIYSIIPMLIVPVLLLTKRVNTKSTVPFIPFLYVGILIFIFVRLNSSF